MIQLIKNLEELRVLSIKIAESIQPGDILTLSGDLGSGKTTLTQMIALELLVKDKVTSPTFNIVKTYNSSKGLLHHIDAYRLEEIKNKEMFDDYLYHEGISIVEWPEFLDINKKTKSIKITILSENERGVHLDGFNI